MSWAIETCGLTKRFEGVTVLDDVTLRVRKGDVYGFLGPNGAGKTTLMRSLFRLVTPDAGTVSLLEQPVRKGSNPVFARVGSILGSPAFFEGLSARENLTLHCAYMGADAGRVDEALALFGLSGAEDKAAGKLSLGMRQRLGLARAIVTDPELLVLDEPMNGLDPEGIIEVRNILRAVNEELGVTIFVSSHLLDELSKIACTVGLIDRGRMLDEATVGDLHDSDCTLESWYLEKTGARHGKAD